MTTQRTVFVIGAGASFEMGLPVGDKLKESISGLLSYRFEYGKPVGGDGLIFQALQQVAQSSPTLTIGSTTSAAKEIARALPLALSIDNYLHNHNGDKSVELCGKLAIVSTILSAESNSTLYLKPSDGVPLDFNRCAKAWLVPFMQLLSEDCNITKLKDRLGTLTFIVFNYDRCLEHFLMHAIMAVYRVSRENAAELVAEIAIFHPYGTVGRLPWMRTDESEIERIDFGGTPQPANLLKLAEGIKTFTEGTVDTSSDIIAIRDCVQTASRFVFLGFAYHRLNMQLLLGENPKSKTTRRVFGTAFGMSDSDTSMVRDFLDNHLFAPSVAPRNDLTCFQLFHEFSRTLGFA